MTITTTIIKNSFSGNGSTTVFAYSFKIATTADMEVIIRSSTGTETVKSLTTHYTVSGAGSASGGNVTMGTPPATGETLVIRRSTTQTQALDLVENDPFTADSMEGAFDKNLSVAQELQEQIDRSLKISRTNTMTSTEFTTSATDRASKILAFDSSGELAITQELGTVRGNWAASTAYAVRDIVKDSSNNNIYICLTLHTSSGSTPISSNTDVAKWSLLVDAASSTTSATAAATSATAAATSATAAASSASAAGTSASNASTSASTASTQASNASTSASSASTSATSAAASYDSFDDRYLGSKSSDPSVDNDGNSLLTGALYFNSSTNQIFSYTGSTWVAIKPTSSEQTAINNAATNATNAANSATASATSATASATSATAAATSATAAASSATAAASSATAALGDLDTFQDQYLGVKSADPSVDNDGDALTSGDLYFNSSTSILRIYDGSSWVSAAVDTSTMASAGFSIAMSVAL